MTPDPTRTPLQLKSAPNFRDLGGIACAGGRRLSCGLFYRSGVLTALAAEEFELLRGCGLKTVIDLRSGAERERIATPWPETFRPAELHWDVNADMQAGNDKVFAPLIANATAEGAREQIRHTYRLFPAAFAPRLGALFDQLLADQIQPLLFHCAVGKDRTGFLAALILLALGAETDCVLEDYMRSVDLVDRPPLVKLTTAILRRQLGFEPAMEIVEPLVSVHPSYLLAALEKIGEEYGSVPGYLERVAGMDEGRLERLRDRLCS